MRLISASTSLAEGTLSLLSALAVRSWKMVLSLSQCWLALVCTRRAGHAGHLVGHGAELLFGHGSILVLQRQAFLDQRLEDLAVFPRA